MLSSLPILAESGSTMLPPLGFCPSQETRRWGSPPEEGTLPFTPGRRRKGAVCPGVTARLWGALPWPEELGMNHERQEQGGDAPPSDSASDQI